MPILPGTDGERRMAKSLGNYIGVTEPPEEIYGKTLSIPDDGARGPGTGCCWASTPPPELGPRDAKRALARALVARFHGAGGRGGGRAGVRPRPHRAAGSRGDADRDLAGRSARGAPAGAARDARSAISTSEARRSLAQGGVKLDGETVGDGALDLPAAEVDGKVLQLGKRRFARVRVE